MSVWERTYCPLLKEGHKEPKVINLSTRRMNKDAQRYALILMEMGIISWSPRKITESKYKS